MNQLETAANCCAICQSSDISVQLTKGLYQYVKCARCHVLRQFPYPTHTEISAYYDKYHSMKSAESVYLSDEGYALFARDKTFTFNDLGINTTAFHSKRLLDVGCATGQFLQMMQELGATDLTGIDASAECLDIAQKRGFNCYQQDFLQHHGLYDIISMWHLIEHVMDPNAYLKKAFELLAPGGWLLLETPVTGEISDAFGSDWRYLMPVEHVHLFPFATLVQLANKSGFALQRFIRFGSGNNSDQVKQPNKGAMDRLAKGTGCGDTLAMWLIKPVLSAE